MKRPLSNQHMKTARLALGAVCLVGLLAMTMITPAFAAVQENDTTDINLTVFVPCAAGGAGELVDLSGPLHTLVSATVNNNKASGYFHFQPQGITGTGETTGLKYQAVGLTQQSFSGSLQNGQLALTFVNNFYIIGQGPGNNFQVHETLHITINADGSVTVSHDNFSATCQ